MTIKRYFTLFFALSMLICTVSLQAGLTWSQPADFNEAEPVAAEQQTLLPDDVNTPIDDKGNTRLHIAASTGQLLAVQDLLAADANVHARNKDDHTPLFFVADPAIIDALIQAGAEVNAQSSYNFTPLRALVSNYTNVPKALLVLLKHGANINQLQGVRLTQGLYDSAQNAGALSYILAPPLPFSPGQAAVKLASGTVPVPVLPHRIVTVIEKEVLQIPPHQLERKIAAIEKRERALIEAIQLIYQQGAPYPSWMLNPDELTVRLYAPPSEMTPDRKQVYDGLEEDWKGAYDEMVELFERQGHTGRFDQMSKTPQQASEMSHNAKLNQISFWIVYIRGHNQIGLDQQLAVLNRLGLTLDDIKEHVRDYKGNIKAFIKPDIEDLERVIYFQDQVLPELKRRFEPMPSIDATPAPL